MLIPFGVLLQEASRFLYVKAFRYACAQGGPERFRSGSQQEEMESLARPALSTCAFLSLGVLGVALGEPKGTGREPRWCAPRAFVASCSNIFCEQLRIRANVTFDEKEKVAIAVGEARAPRTGTAIVQLDRAVSAAPSAQSKLVECAGRTEPQPSQWSCANSGNWLRRGGMKNRTAPHTAADSSRVVQFSLPVTRAMEPS